jgi:predicted esterase YcpF (UPF0227 family)
MRKILYLNGYKSKLILPKHETLSEYGELIAPYVDHHVEKDIYLKFEKIVKEEKIDVIIGSSMGGALGFLLSCNYNIPALLFNPAVPYYEGHFSPNETITAYQKIVLGKLDTIIVPQKTLDFLSSYELPKLKIEMIADLEHKIPVNVFKQEIDLFIKELNEYK